MQAFDVKLETIEILSASTRDFRFVRCDGEAVDFKPGQFFRFAFQDERGEFERSYSLCNFKEGNLSSHLDLVVSRVEHGRATRLLFECEPGLRAQVKGPYGRLLVPDILPKRLFFVATSVGIAPFMPMLAQLSPALKAHQLEVHFVYGTREPAEFVYGDKLIDFAKQHSGFHLSVCYSRRLPENPNAYEFEYEYEFEFEFEGYVQERLKALSLNAETDHLLLCGHPVMIDETYAWLKQKGFKPRQVVREKYVFAKDALSTPKKVALSEEQRKLIAEKMKKYQK